MKRDLLTKQFQNLVRVWPNIACQKESFLLTLETWLDWVPGVTTVSLFANKEMDGFTMVVDEESTVQIEEYVSSIQHLLKTTGMWSL